MKLLRLKKMISLLCCILAIVLAAATGTAAQSPNRLYFSARDGELYYDTDLFDAARFMQHLDMSPGDIYRDELSIQNGSKLPYDLYFQAVPVIQSEKSDELLENVNMHIRLDGVLIYEGRASGQDYSGVNLRNVISVGRYPPGKRALLAVDLEFSPDYEPAEYVVRARIDWKFWGVGKDGEKPIKPNPQTGDTGYLRFAAVAALSAAVLVILLAAPRKRKRAVKRTESI